MASSGLNSLNLIFVLGVFRWDRYQSESRNTVRSGQYQSHVFYKALSMRNKSDQRSPVTLWNFDTDEALAKCAICSAQKRIEQVLLSTKQLER